MYAFLIKVFVSILTALLAIPFFLNDPPGAGTEVQVVGEMKKTMWNGELEGKILLDTIVNKKSLYGIGPEAFMTGEIIIVDGQAFVSRVKSDSTMEVEETFEIKAPFFVYSNVNSWEKVTIPTSVSSIRQLEAFIDSVSKKPEAPFTFKLKGKVKSAKVHVQNLPPGTVVKSPKDAHQGQKSYLIHDREVEIVGYYSTKHQGVFTHHDSFVHMHLITTDKKMIGHLDDVDFGKNKVELFFSDSM